MSSWTVEQPALVDSEAAGVFIDEEFIKKLKIQAEQLPINIKVCNIDGILNQNGSIMKKVIASLDLKGKYM